VERTREKEGEKEERKRGGRMRLTEKKQLRSVAGQTAHPTIASQNANPQHQKSDPKDVCGWVATLTGVFCLFVCFG
jgi:hypothetical protein